MTANKELTQAQDALLGIHNKPWYKKTKTWFLTVLTVAIAAAAAYWLTKPPTATRYVSLPVSRGDLRVTVTADGTLNPVREVSIGSELSGIVSKVNVDVNSEVKKGDVLIELDTSKLQSTVNQERAQLASAKAQLSNAKADLYDAQTKWKRYEDLNKSSGGQLPSRTEMETQTAAVLKAQAQVEVAQANIQNAQAALTTAETDLSKAYIRSPVDGVVLNRSVEPGYAVAASLQAVELLTVATDLRQLKLEVDIDEADVGSVKAGQNTTFTVAAYPDKHFPAQFYKVAFGATSSGSSSSSSLSSSSSASASASGVVTYTGYLTVDNPQLALRPGMSATATIETATLKNVLLVPNSALRFTPAQTGTSKSMAMFGGPPRDTKKVKESLSGQGQRQRSLYVMRGSQAQKITITTGLSNGTMTQVISGDLKEGDQVAVDQLKTMTH